VFNKSIAHEEAVTNDLKTITLKRGKFDVGYFFKILAG
jgi:hypothetical protein